MARTRGKDKGGSPLVATGDQHQRLPVKKQRRARNPSTIVAAVADAVAAADAAAAVDQPGPTFELQDLVDIVEGNGPTQRHLPTGPMTVPPPTSGEGENEDHHEPEDKQDNGNQGDAPAQVDDHAERCSEPPVEHSEGNSPTQRHLPTGPMTVLPPISRRGRERYYERYRWREGGRE